VHAKTTICFLWPWYAGDVTSVDDLVAGFDPARYSVLFVYLGDRRPGDNHLRDAGFAVVYLSRKTKVRSFSPGLTARLARVLKDHQVDILHCHKHKSTLYGALAGTLAGTPVVCAHVHGLDRTRTRRRRLLNYFLYKKVRMIVGVAGAVAQDVLACNWRLPRDRVTVLENSIEYHRFADVAMTPQEARDLLGLPRQAFVYGTIGRLAPTKGLTYMLEAFARVRAHVPQAHLVLIGTGPEADRYQAQTRALGIGEAVTFAGYRQDIEKVIRALDVFVMASVAEGMPRVLLEAMAARVPCIATRVGGIPEIITDADTGWLVPSRAVAPLADAMAKAAALPAGEMTALRDAAQRRIQQCFSHEVTREKLRQLYETLLAEVPAGRGHASRGLST